MLIICNSLCEVALVISDSLGHLGACQAPLPMGFSRQGYWRGCHPLLQRILLTQGSTSLISPALAGVLFTISTTWEAPSLCFI